MREGANLTDEKVVKDLSLVTRRSFACVGSGRHFISGSEDKNETANMT